MIKQASFDNNLHHLLFSSVFQVYFGFYLVPKFGVQSGRAQQASFVQCLRSEPELDGPQPLLRAVERGWVHGKLYGAGLDGLVLGSHGVPAGLERVRGEERVNTGVKLGLVLLGCYGVELGGLEEEKIGGRRRKTMQRGNAGGERE